MLSFAERAAPARTPTRPPIQDTLWAAGWGRGPVRCSIKSKN